MESFLNRYRSITVLLLVLFAQLVLLAVQVKNDQDVRIIRLWTVTAVMPVARVVEWVRGGSIGFIRNYFVLREAGEENRRLRGEVGRLRMENNYLKNELSTADRAKALQAFQARTPSRTLAANVVGIGAGSNSKVVFVNRGSTEGVMRGNAVVTPDGIVGKVIAAYPLASEVLLITDPEFAAGVISEKQQARGTLKGQGNPTCKVDYVAFEDKVEPGEWFYTSGEDRIFPRGFQVGIVKSVKPGQPFKEILLEPSGLQHGLEDVLILISNVHQDLPDMPFANQPVYISPAPPASPGGATVPPQPAGSGTEADRLRRLYQSTGEAQGHTFGEGAPGSKPPDFTKMGTAGSQGAPAGKPISSPDSGAPPARPTTAPAPTGPAARPTTTPVPDSPSARPIPAPAPGAPPATKQNSAPAPTAPATKQTPAPPPGKGTPR